MATGTTHRSRRSRRGRAIDPLVERYLKFVESRARHNTLLATESDLRVFFGVVPKSPVEVTAQDVLGFIVEQRRGEGNGRVVRLVDGEAGLSSRTIKRRLSSVSGLFSYLVLCGDVAVNPVPRGLATRRRGSRGVALVRTPHTLPKILIPAEVDALMPKLIAAYPDDYVYAYRYGRSLLERKQPAAALPYLEQAAGKTFGVNRLMVATLRVQALLALKRRDDAEKVVAEALQENGPWFPEQAQKLKDALKG